MVTENFPSISVWANPTRENSVRAKVSKVFFIDVMVGVLYSVGIEKFSVKTKVSVIMRHTSVKNKTQVCKGMKK